MFKTETIDMSKIMQNMVLLVNPKHHASNVSLKAVNMCLNRFCIDEDAAFESSGVYYFKESSEKSSYIDLMDLERKGREFLFIKQTV